MNILEENIDFKYLKRYFFSNHSSSRLIEQYRSNVYLNPNDWFNRRIYLAKNEDVNNAGQEPFEHYVLHGKKEGRKGCFENQAEYFEIAPKLVGPKKTILSIIILSLFFSKKEAIVLRKYFDTIHYRHQLRSLKMLPTFCLLIHYFFKGKVNKLSPSVFYKPSELKSNISFIDVVDGFKSKKEIGLLIENSYEKWIVENENWEDETVASEIDSFGQHPLISIIIPTYNAPIQYLKQAIESVRNQRYTNWEICISDDASTDLSTIDYLKSIESNQIKINYRTSNGHISLNTNNALELAQGEFIALLDQDDVLSPYALFEVVKQINATPSVKLIFSGEDKIDEYNNRSTPHLKKGWNYHLLLNQNYVSHLGVYKTSIVNGLNGFRIGYEGSQDYDMLLRFIEQIDETDIQYIDKILYHWRAIEGSTALSIDEKDYAWKAGKKAIEEHLARTGQEGSVEKGIIPIYYRVKRKITTTPLVSVIIPNKNHLNDLKLAVKSVLECDYKNVELIIIDNDSTDKQLFKYYTELQNKHKNSIVFNYPGEFNYSAINNYAVTKAKGELLLFLNNDVQSINNDWLAEMVSQIEQPNIGGVGAKLLYPDNTIQHCGVEIGMGGVAGHIYKLEPANSHSHFGRIQLTQEYDACTAACLLIKKDLFTKVNGFDEKHLKVAFNDVDLCLKIRDLNYKILYTPYAVMYHFESKSRGSDLEGDKLIRFNREMNFMSKKYQQQ